MSKIKNRKIIIYVLAFFCICAIAAGAYYANSLNTKPGNITKISDTAQATPSPSPVVTKTQKEQKHDELEQKFLGARKAFDIEKNPNKALKMANEILNEDDKFYEALSLKGIILCFSHKYNDGMSSIVKSLSIKPDYGYALFNRGLANELYANYTEALYWYNKDIQVESYEWTYYGIASIYGRRGDVANTVKYLKVAMNMDPYIKEKSKTEVDFNNVRGHKEFEDLLK